MDDELGTFAMKVEDGGKTGLFVGGGGNEGGVDFLSFEPMHGYSVGDIATHNGENGGFLFHFGNADGDVRGTTGNLREGGDDLYFIAVIHAEFAALLFQGAFNAGAGQGDEGVELDVANR